MKNWSTLLVVSVLLGGCTAIRAEKERSKPSSIEQVATAERLLSQLLGFVDQFALALTEEVDQVKQTSEDPRVRAVAHERLYMTVASAIDIAVQPNPAVSLSDMIVMVRLERAALEHHWIPEVLGESGQGLLSVLRDFEQRIWAISEPFSNPEELEMLRRTIDEWVASEPRYWRAGSWARLGDLAENRMRSAVEMDASASIFSSLPRALSTAQQAQLLAERSLYLAKRMPLLTAWQIEDRLYSLGQIHEIERGLDATLRLSTLAADQLEELPELLAREREAILDTVFEQLVVERENLFRELEQGDQRLRSLLAEIRPLFEAGRELAANAEAATTTLDGALERLGHEDGRPLSADDLSVLLKETTGSLRQANSLVELLDDVMSSPALKETPPALLAAVEEIETSTRRTIDHLFWRALLLILVLLGGLLVVGLLLRYLTRSWSIRN
jgi:hypothetical protein